MIIIGTYLLGNPFVTLTGTVAREFLEDLFHLIVPPGSIGTVLFPKAIWNLNIFVESL